MDEKFNVAKMMMTDFTPDLYLGSYKGTYAINALISSCNLELFKLGVERGLVQLNGTASPLGKPLLFVLFDNNWVSFGN